MKTSRMRAEDAESLAIEALGFISSDPTLLQRFLAITGISASEVRRAAAEPGFLAGVMNFIAAHEPTLIAFASSVAVEPQSVTEALRLLQSGDEQYERST